MRVWRPDRSGAGGKRPRAPEGSSVRSGWPADRPAHLLFTLHKSNVDTMTALRALARAVGIREKAFACAGVKDKRGVTSQQVSAYHVEAGWVVRATGGSSGRGDPRLPRGLLTGDYSYVAEGLKAGGSGGNRFDLILRNLMPVAGEQGNIAASVAVAEARLASFRASGSRFPNYYGLQRFGSGVGGPGATQAIGLALLSRDWAGAVGRILGPRGPAWEGGAGAAVAPEPRFRRSDWDEAEDGARAVFAETSNAAAALASWPERGALERPLLASLAAAQKRAGENAGGGGGASGRPPLIKATGGRPARMVLPAGSALDALIAIPPRMRALYVHAAQSVVWNAMASGRMRRAVRGVEGDAAAAVRVLPGDLVLVDGSMGGLRVDEEGGEEGDEGEGEGGAEADGTAPAILPAVRALTVAEAASGAFTLDDVVLPLPGYAVAFPGLEEDEEHPASSSAYAACLRAHGLAVPASSGPVAEEEALRALFKPADARFHFPGGYRALSVAARDVAWRFVTAPAVSGEADFLASDVDALRAAHGSHGRAPVESASALPDLLSPAAVYDAGAGAPAAQGGSMRLHLQLSFSLPPGAYATMLLREVTRGGARQ
jgi:tRNA pseudouridine13 synthase